MPGEEGHLISEGVVPGPGFVPLDSEPSVPGIAPEPVNLAGNPTRIPVSYGREDSRPDQAVDVVRAHDAEEVGYSDRTAAILASQTENVAAEPEVPVTPTAESATIQPEEPAAFTAEKDIEDTKDAEEFELPAPTGDADAIAADIDELEHRKEAGEENEEAHPENLSQAEQAEIMENIALLLREHEVSPRYRDARLAVNGDISKAEGLLALGIKIHQAFQASDKLKFEDPKEASDKLAIATSGLKVLVDIKSGVASDPDYKLPAESSQPLQLAA